MEDQRPNNTMDQVGRFLLLNGEEVTVDAPQQLDSLMQWKLALLSPGTPLAGTVPSHHWLEILKDGEPVAPDGAAILLYDGAEPMHLPNHEYRVVALKVPEMPPSVGSAIHKILHVQNAFPDPYNASTPGHELEFLGGLWRIYRDEVKPSFEPLARHEKHGKAGWWLRVSEVFREQAVARAGAGSPLLNNANADVFRFARFDTPEGREFLHWLSADRAATFLAPTGGAVIYFPGTGSGAIATRHRRSEAPPRPPTALQESSPGSARPPAP